MPDSYQDKLELDGPLIAGDSSWNGDEGRFISQKGKLKAELWIGGYQLKNAQANFSPHIEEPLLGSSFFKYFTITFDLKNKRVRMTKNPQSGEIIMPD